jgi:hypothetical protein
MCDPMNDLSVAKKLLIFHKIIAEKPSKTLGQPEKWYVENCAKIVLPAHA